MKAITLYQPWASLVASGSKKYETRSWSTKHRGPLIIHAAKRFTAKEEMICNSAPFAMSLVVAGFRRVSEIPTGAALCMVNLVDVFRVEDVLGNLSEMEQAFGDYGPERFAWKLEMITVFPEPIPMRGRQRIWNLTQEALTALPLGAVSRQGILPLADFGDEAYVS